MSRLLMHRGIGTIAAMPTIYFYGIAKRWLTAQLAYGL
jgi:hypothetical protein